MANHTFTIREATARLIYSMAAERAVNFRHMLASAVERGDNKVAKSIVADLRAVENVFATFNMDAKLKTDPGKTDWQEHVRV